MPCAPRLVLSALASGLLLLAGCGGGNSVASGASPVFTYSLAVNPTSLTFANAVVGIPSSQTVTIASTGTGPIVISAIGVQVSGTATASVSNTCSQAFTTIPCAATVTVTPAAAGAFTGTLTIVSNATTPSTTVAITGTATAPAPTFTATVTPATLNFPNSYVGVPSAPQVVTFTNTGTGVLSFAQGGLVTSASFLFSTTCGTTLAVGASCTATLAADPAASSLAITGTLNFGSNATNVPLGVTITGSAIATPLATAIADCSVTGGTCGAALPLQTIDPIAAGGFHGYADPSFRKDPNSSYSYLSYSWPRTLADGTHVVDLHLAQSANGGTSFSELGPLYQSAVSTQTASSAYSTTNDSSNEVSDLLPIALTGAAAGQTLWVQAHQAYLVKPQGGIYDQLNPTGVISVTAVQLATPAAAGAGSSLLALSSPATGEARLGVGDTDPTRNVTQNLGALSPNTARCGNLGQPALWYQNGTLYLALECTEVTGNGNIDANELAHFLYSTTPAGADASKWTWAYAGEFATGAQAAKFGTLASEGVGYQFFTEPAFAQTRAGQLVILMTPSVFAPASAQQPVIQYGCRAFPITLSPTSVTIDTDNTTGALVDIAKTTEADLYTTPNEGPAACTYEPASNLGIVMGRKLENDPAYGFYIYPVNTGIAP